MLLKSSMSGRPLRTEAASMGLRTEAAAPLFYPLRHEDVFSKIVLNNKGVEVATNKQTNNQKTPGVKMSVRL